MFHVTKSKTVNMLQRPNYTVIDHNAYFIRHQLFHNIIYSYDYTYYLIELLFSVYLRCYNIIKNKCFRD